MSDSPPQRLTGWRGRLLNLGLLLAGLLIALLLAELACRIFVGNPPDLLDKNDPVFGSRYRRNAQATRIVDGHQVPVAINSEGFHSPELPHQRTTGSARLLFLGDSFTAATEVPLAETFAQRTAAELSRGDRPVEAVNLGISGFNNAQELLVWRTVGADYQPDLVVLMVFPGNDVSDNVPELAATNMPFFVLDEQGELTELPFKPRWSKKTRWIRDSALYKWQKVVLNRALRSAQETAEVLPRYDVYRPPVDETWRRAWAITEALLLAMADETKAHGAQLLLALIPEKIQSRDQDFRSLLDSHPLMKSETWDLDYPNRRLAEFGVRHDIQVLDPVEAFRTASQQQSLYNVEDFHFNAAGHRLMARLIAERIAADKDWLPPAETSEQP